MSDTKDININKFIQQILTNEYLLNVRCDVAVHKGVPALTKLLF